MRWRLSVSKTAMKASSTGTISISALATCPASSLWEAPSWALPTSPTLTVTRWSGGPKRSSVTSPKRSEPTSRSWRWTVWSASAVTVAAEGIDKLHTTAQSHHRVMIIEVMGRNAGWIALHAGVASGGDVILIPEIPYDIKKVAEKVRERNQRGMRYTIIVVAEGARPAGGKVVVRRVVKESTDPVRLGGIGFVLGTEIERLTGIETRTVVLGHLQRSGIPTPFDRVLATRLGCEAVEMVARGQFGQMVGIKGNALTRVPLEEVAKGQRLIKPGDLLINVARSVETTFWD